MNDQELTEYQNIMSENKYGKNYLGKPKKQKILTWSIELSPEFLD